MSRDRTQRSRRHNAVIPHAGNVNTGRIATQQLMLDTSIAVRDLTRRLSSNRLACKLYLAQGTSMLGQFIHISDHERRYDKGQVDEHVPHQFIIRDLMGIHEDT